MAYPDYTNNFDTKWKDQSTPCKYDVDDPTFCSPMSVLSGLVSGFCERQAVVNSNFVTGTTASPVTVDWSATTQASRNAIVDSCVQHVAAHDLLPSQVGAESYKGPVSAAFMPADHDAKVDGNVTVDTTYMTHMDNLITSLVETGEYRTDLTGGTAYTTFAQLASSASAAVAGTVSAITSVPVQGGTNYSQEFMPSFPKEWAKERKWMLEQLRYTAGQKAYAGPYVAGGICGADFNSGGDGYAYDSSHTFQTLEDCRSRMVGSAQAGVVTEDAYAYGPRYEACYCGMNSGVGDNATYNIPYQGAIGRNFYWLVSGNYYVGRDTVTIGGSSVDATTLAVGDVVGGERIEEVTPYSVVTSKSGDWYYYSRLVSGQMMGWCIHDDPGQNPNTPRYSVDWLASNATVVLPANLNTKNRITTEIGWWSPFKYTDANFGAVTSIVSGETTMNTRIVSDGSASAIESNYEVKSGGHLIIGPTGYPYAVVVSSGGTVTFSNGGCAETCMILDGGIVKGFPNAAYLGISGFYPYPNGEYPWTYHAPDPRMASSTFVNVTGNSTNPSGSAFLVQPGATLTFSRRYVSSALVLVSSGGHLRLTGNSTSSTEMTESLIKVLPGGSFTVDSWSRLNYGTVLAFPDSHIVLNELYVNNGADMCAHVDGELHAAPGSTVSVHMNVSSSFEWRNEYYWDYLYLDMGFNLYYAMGGFASNDVGGHPVIEVDRVFQGKSVVPYSAEQVPTGGIRADSDCISKNTHIYICVTAGLTAQDGTAIKQGTTAVDLSGVSVGTKVLQYTFADGAFPSTAEPPLSGFHIGWNSTKLLGAFSIISISIDDPGVRDHYKEFKLRQNAT